MGYNGFGKRFGAAWLANKKERDPQVNADGHHEYVLSESSIFGNVRS